VLLRVKGGFNERTEDVLQKLLEVVQNVFRSVYVADRKAESVRKHARAHNNKTVLEQKTALQTLQFTPVSGITSPAASGQI